MEIIYKTLQSGKPSAIGKIGANELNFLYVILLNSNQYKEVFTYNVCVQAGVFPIEHAEEFMIKEYLPSISDVDIIAEWNANKEFEKYLLNLKAPKSIRVELQNLEPYYYDLHWTDHLKNKKVLIISPFTESFEKQYLIKDKIWKNYLLPDFEAIYLKFPLSFYLVEQKKSYYENSSVLLNEYKKKMENIDFDVALIGTGVYGLPLAVHAKKLGKIGYHLGGPLQILFGVKGSRWDKYNFYNEYWIKPNENETPLNKHACENGCYW